MLYEVITRLALSLGVLHSDAPVEPHLPGVNLLVPKAAGAGAGMRAQLAAERLYGLSVFFLARRRVEVEQVV